MTHYLEHVLQLQELEKRNKSPHQILPQIIQNQNPVVEKLKMIDLGNENEGTNQ